MFFLHQLGQIASKQTSPETKATFRVMTYLSFPTQQVNAHNSFETLDFSNGLSNNSVFSY